MLPTSRCSLSPPGKGKETVAAFRAFMLAHGGEPTRIAEVVCDMSAAFLAAAGEAFPNAAVTVFRVPDYSELYAGCRLIPFFRQSLVPRLLVGFLGTIQLSSPAGIFPEL